MALITDDVKKTAEVYHGDAICKEKSKHLLKEIGLPNGLLPLHDIEECGYVKETGLVWLKQKNSITHKFEKINRATSYATEVTAYAEKGRIKRLTGVKSKELLIWVTISEIYIDEKQPEKITFKSLTGLSKTFPVSAFVVEEPEGGEEKKEDDTAGVKTIQV